jgi:hypothetical protein
MRHPPTRFGTADTGSLPPIRWYGIPIFVGQGAAADTVDRDAPNRAGDPLHIGTSRTLGR